MNMKITTEIKAGSALKALNNGDVITAGVVDNKTVPFQLDELLEQTAPDCPCKVIKGNSPEKGDTYYIWTFPEKESFIESAMPKK